MNSFYFKTVPPVDPPDIAGYMNQPLFEGDSLDLVCTAKGGKPTVLSVTLSCPGVASLSSNVTAYGQEVKITINVVAKDHLHECICTSRWLRDDAYTLHSKIVLLVFSKYSKIKYLLTCWDSVERESKSLKDFSEAVIIASESSARSLSGLVMTEW